MNFDEKWNTIRDWEGIYEVSNLGRVKSLERKVEARAGSKRTVRERILKPNPVRGYPTVYLSRPKCKQKQYKVHRLVAEAFIPNPENKPFVNHINGNKQDNRVENLEWVTAFENVRHAITTGLANYAKGFSSGKAKLKEHEVLDICNMIDSRNLTHSAIAGVFGVTEGAIEAIHLGISWNHLTGRRGNVELVKEYKTPVSNCRGEVFQTVQQAAKAYKTYPCSISRVCRGKRKTSGKYEDGTRIKWKYIERS